MRSTRLPASPRSPRPTDDPGPSELRSASFWAAERSANSSRDRWPSQLGPDGQQLRRRDLRPYGDYWEVHNNAEGHTSVIYHYKGINDRFKSAAEVSVQGRTVVKRNVIEGRRIIFWVIGPDHRVSSKSEYRTSGR